jgi:hypothetical protein
VRKIKEFRNYLWVLILIGGILVLISIFTPVIHHPFSVPPFGLEYYYWMWGLFYQNGYGFFFDAGLAPIHRLIPHYIIRLIPTILILLSSILLIIMANRLRLGSRHIKSVENKLIIYGLILILAPIIFIVSYNLFSESYDIFITYIEYPGFAFIAPFIGGALAIVVGISSIYKISEEEKNQ